MNAEALLNDLMRRGVRFEPRGERLHIEAPAGVLSDADRAALSRCKEELLSLLSAETLPGQSLEYADRFCSAWRGACHELAEACGWPELSFRAGHAVAPGEANWRKFLQRAGVPDLQGVLVALRHRLADLGMPHGTGGGEEGRHD